MAKRLIVSGDITTNDGMLSSDMMDALNKSSRVIKRTTYPKKK